MEHIVGVYGYIKGIILDIRHSKQCIKLDRKYQIFDSMNSKIFKNVFSRIIYFVTY